jgi:hypothetical protein
MAEFLRDLTAPSWWLSVVVVGIAINLASAYIKPRLDERVGTFSAKRHLRTQQQRQARTKLVAQLAADEIELQFIAFSEIRHRLRSIMLMLMGVMAYLGALIAKAGRIPESSRFPMGLTGESAVFAVGTLAFFLGYLEFRSAVKDKLLLFDARHQRRESFTVKAASSEMQTDTSSAN